MYSDTIKESVGHPVGIFDNPYNSLKESLRTSVGTIGVINDEPLRNPLDFNSHTLEESMGHPMDILKTPYEIY